jgi:hypothetical protein
MDSAALQDRISKGMGAAARQFGAMFTLYRPRGPSQPIGRHSRVMELPAAFRAAGSSAPRAPVYGQPLWQGIFDASYTRAGDYLVGRDETYFVASQKPALPVQCVLTNRTVTIVRPLPAAPGGYSGLYESPGESVILGWPASLLETAGHAAGVQANETRYGSWFLLLPEMPAIPQVADVVTDDRGGTYVVGAAEQSNLGWRLLVRQIGA